MKTTPSDVLNGATSVNVDNWGTLFANIHSASCDMSSHFGPHNIIIDLTFCECNVSTSYGPDELIELLGRR